MKLSFPQLKTEDIKKFFTQNFFNFLGICFAASIVMSIVVFYIYTNPPSDTLAPTAGDISFNANTLKTIHDILNARESQFEAYRKNPPFIKDPF